MIENVSFIRYIGTSVLNGKTRLFLEFLEFKAANHRIEKRGRSYSYQISSAKRKPLSRSLGQRHRLRSGRPVVSEDDFQTSIPER